MLILPFSSTTTEQTSTEDDLQPQDGEEDEEEGAVKDNEDVAEIKGCCKQYIVYVLKKQMNPQNVKASF